MPCLYDPKRKSREAEKLLEEENTKRREAVEAGISSGFVAFAWVAAFYIQSHEVNECSFGGVRAGSPRGKKSKKQAPAVDSSSSSGSIRQEFPTAHSPQKGAVVVQGPWPGHILTPAQEEHTRASTKTRAHLKGSVGHMQFERTWLLRALSAPYNNTSCQSCQGHS